MLPSSGGWRWIKKDETRPVKLRTHYTCPRASVHAPCPVSMACEHECPKWHHEQWTWASLCTPEFTGCGHSVIFWHPWIWPVDTGVILDTCVQGCRHDPWTRAVCTALKWSQCLVFPSMVWHCWLGDRKDIWTVEKSVPLNDNGSFSATSGGKYKRTANPVVKTEVGKFIRLLTYLFTGNTVMSVHNWNTDSEENEEFLIALTDAVVNPWTVMIHLLYAPVTYAAATTRKTDLLHYYYVYTLPQEIQTPITFSNNLNKCESAIEWVQALADISSSALYYTYNYNYNTDGIVPPTSWPRAHNTV